MWAYKARDAVATAMHGMWGSFWIGYGILNLIAATKTLAAGTTIPGSPRMKYLNFISAVDVEQRRIGIWRPRSRIAKSLQQRIGL